MSENILIEYAKVRSLYEEFAAKLRACFQTLLDEAKIKYHTVECRTKTEKSFAEKIRRPGKSYSDYTDITDLSGLRVIVYYEDDIERVSRVVYAEFNVLDTAFGGKTEPDRFGYNLPAFVVQLNAMRNHLPDWSKFSTFKSEVQVRTVIQHGWAAVSHALQYKSDVPPELGRRLNRLVGLFEIADEEFVSLRKAHERAIEDAKAQTESGSTNIPVTGVSVAKFVAAWEDLKPKKEIATKYGIKFVEKGEEGYDDDDAEDYAAVVAAHCVRLGIRTIDDLQQTLSIDPTPFLQRAVDGNPWRMPEVFFVFLLLINARHDDFSFHDLLREGWHNIVAERVIRAARNSERPRG